MPFHQLYSNRGLGRRAAVTRLLCLACVAALLGVRCGRLERLLEVRDDVVDVLRADRYSDKVFRYAAADALLLAELFVRLGKLSVRVPLNI